MTEVTGIAGCHSESAFNDERAAFYPNGVITVAFYQLTQDLGDRVPPPKLHERLCISSNLLCIRISINRTDLD